MATMTKIEDAIAILESLKRTEHYECDDSYYSCPKLERTAGRYDDTPISERLCDCGMDELNAGLESAIAILRSTEDESFFDTLAVELIENATNNAKRRSNPPASQSPSPQAEPSHDRA